MYNIFLINNSKINFFGNKKINFILDLDKSDTYRKKYFIFNNEKINKKTIEIDNKGNIYCLDIKIIKEEDKKYFYIGNIKEKNILDKIFYFFENLEDIFLHNLVLVSNIVELNKNYTENLKHINFTDFLKEKNINDTLVSSKKILIPSELNVGEKLKKIYKIIEKKQDFVIKNNIFFDDFILSLLPLKLWGHSIFFLKSNLKFKISNFFNEYEDIISLQIPVARSKFLKDLFELLLLQSNKKFNIFIGVDAYDERQKEEICKIISEYKNKFKTLSYFINKNNLGVGKTRQKLMDIDKKSKYIVFLDDDVFLDYEAIENLYNQINKNLNIGLYSIENVDVRFDANYKDYIFKDREFEQPGVYTDRKIENRFPLYVNQEETPVIFNRFYVDLLDEDYHETFDKCSLDLFYNRVLSLICGNINIKGIYQFNRVGHQYHQTREKGFLLEEFKYILYILDRISYLSNNNEYYELLIKTQFPKQNELFK